MLRTFTHSDITSKIAKHVWLRLLPPLLLLGAGGGSVSSTAAVPTATGTSTSTAEVLF
jgi:hypothetical protein